MDAYADAYGWNDRWSKTLLDLNRFSSDGKQFGSGDLYGVSQQGEIVGVFYNKDKVASIAQDVRRVRGHARQGEGRRRGPDLVRQPRQVRRHPRVPDRPERVREQGRRCATSCSPRTARASTRPRTSRRPRSSRSGPTRATSRRTSTAPATTPPGRRSRRARARSRSPAPGSPTTRYGEMGDKLGFFLLPPPRGGQRAGRARRREPAVGDHRRSPRTPTWRPPTSTSSPTPRPPTCRSRPTTCRRWQANTQPSSPVSKDVFAAWKTLSDNDGLTPYIDYATPTFFDDFSGAVQRLLAGKVKPDAFTKAVQEDYAKFADTL